MKSVPQRRDFHILSSSSLSILQLPLYIVPPVYECVRYSYKTSIPRRGRRIKESISFVFLQEKVDIKDENPQRPKKNGHRFVATRKYRRTGNKKCSKPSKIKNHSDGWTEEKACDAGVQNQKLGCWPCLREHVR